MVPPWSAIATYLQDQAKQRDIDGLYGTFRALVQPFAVDALACGRLHLSDRRLATFFIIDWPTAWRDFYMTSGLLQRDPLLDHLREARGVFTWSELRRDRRLTTAGSEALRRAADHGWTEGLVVPVEISLPFAGLVSLVARRNAFSDEEKAFLTLVSVDLYHRLRDLASGGAMALLPAGLTAREVTCLQLVARGCSDRRVGEALGIATTTAHEHVESAKKKLNATTRSTVIATALSLAVIRPY